MVLSNYQVTWLDVGQLSNRRNPANHIKHIVAKSKVVKVLVFLASLTIACSISTVNGDFLQTCLARALLSPSRVTCINGELVSEGIPAMECAHASPLTASFTADLEAFVSPKCCRYTGPNGLLLLESPQTCDWLPMSSNA